MLPTVVAQLDRDQIQRMNGQLCLDHLYQIQQGCVSEGDTGTECPPENDSAGDQYAIPHCAESSGTLHQTDTDSTQADGVFSASTSVSSVTHENVPFCTNCRQISTQFDEQIVHKTGWRPDIDILRLTPSRNDSASAEISQINNSKREKKFQPLLFSLFDTLNRMMMNEMEDCDELVQMNRKSGGELVGVLNAWHVRQQYLKTMKETLVKLDATACQNAEKSNMAFQDRDLMFGSSSALPVSFGNEPRFNASLSEIQEHIQTWKAGPDPSTTLSSPPLSIKCTMTEDVNSYLSHCTLDIREPNNFSTSRDSSGVFFGAPCGTGNVSVLNPRPTSMHHCASYMSLNIGCHRATNKL
ncbi:hypothetical protein DFQ28_005312 [Apophysomyces sp. BC1034]|nr:hypothetical protein DFQ30_006142 [Apophysomyces sp. BC1015]KAG0178019.1 hypothetical protein DFQ29_004039 [Apophysomyces sp. BC1021]KAG0188166.1 hypothetical protein DFQ28_005312 [Apophysomyces sp. BC1034]